VDPVHVDSFNAYKAAVAATLRPHLGPSARGVAVLLNTRRQTVDVACYHAGEDLTPEASLASVVREALAALPAQFGFAGYHTTFRFARCDPTAPLVYVGCPVWARAGTEWQLDPAVAARIAAQTPATDMSRD
jgi:hypothetical protein